MNKEEKARHDYSKKMIARKKAQESIKRFRKQLGGIYCGPSQDPYN